MGLVVPEPKLVLKLLDPIACLRLHMLWGPVWGAPGGAGYVDGVSVGSRFLLVQLVRRLLFAWLQVPRILM